MILRLIASERNLQNAKIPNRKLSAKVRCFISGYQSTTDFEPLWVTQQTKLITHDTQAECCGGKPPKCKNAKHKLSAKVRCFISGYQSTTDFEPLWVTQQTKLITHDTQAECCGGKPPKCKNAKHKLSAKVRCFISGYQSTTDFEPLWVTQQTKLITHDTQVEC